MATDPVLIDVPSELTTERLVLRVPRPGDGAIINAAARESLRELEPWMPWARNPHPVEESETYARRAHAQFMTREDLPFLALLKGTDTFVVGTGLHRIDWSVPRFEIGYWCRTGLVGHGYVAECVNALTTLAFERLGAQRVEIKMDDRNERSWRVAERCGFALEGIIRNDCRTHHGELRDTRIYAKVRR